MRWRAGVISVFAVGRPLRHTLTRMGIVYISGHEETRNSKTRTTHKSQESDNRVLQDVISAKVLIADVLVAGRRVPNRVRAVFHSVVLSGVPLCGVEHRTFPGCHRNDLRQP